MQMEELQSYTVLVALPESSGLMDMGRALSETVPSEIILSPVYEEALDIARREPVSLLIADQDVVDWELSAIEYEVRNTTSYAETLYLTSETDPAKLSSLMTRKRTQVLHKPLHVDALVRIAVVQLHRFHEEAAKRRRFSDMARTSLKRIKVSAHPAVKASRPDKRPGVKIMKKKKLMKPVPFKEPPKLLDDRYRIDFKINEGGHGTIYKATDTLLDMPVAVKVLSDRFQTDVDAMSGLRREARVAIQLSHKHIVRLHNLQNSKGVFYLVMEYIQGISLGEFLRHIGPMEWSAVLQAVFICADALSYAHRRGILHRDIKPSNLMLREDGVLKIIDFGMACLAQSDRMNEYIVGTPYYISPEELKGQPLDQRADVFSLGVTVHELLTGHLPIEDGAAPPDLKMYHPVSDPRLPDELRAVLDRAMAVKPDQRWVDLNAFARALHQTMPGGGRMAFMPSQATQRIEIPEGPPAA